MANFDNIIQEINTNLPDNTSQSITAAKLRTTLIDLTNQIDAVQDDFEAGLVVDSLKSEDATKALSANNGYELSKREQVFSLEGADNTYNTVYSYCLSGHRYRIYLDNTTPDWSNITYTSASYILWSINVVDYNLENTTEYFSRNCTNKVDPLNSTYEFTANKNGYIRIGYRANVGEFIRIKIEDVTISNELDNRLDSIEQAFSLEQDINIVSSITGSFYSGTVGNQITTSSNSSYRGNQYAVTPGKQYHTHIIARGTAYWLRYTDSNNVILSRHYYSSASGFNTFDGYTTAPENAAYAYVNFDNSQYSNSYFRELNIQYTNINSLDNRIETLETEIQDITDIDDRLTVVEDNMTKIDNVTPLEVFREAPNQRYTGSVGETVGTTALTGCTGKAYVVTPNTDYLFNGEMREGLNISALVFADENDVIINRPIRGTYGTYNYWTNVKVTSPENAVYAYVNATEGYDTAYLSTYTESLIDIEDLRNDVDEIQDELETLVGTPNKLMKVVINGGLNPDEYTNDNVYYIRTKYNENNDIIVQGRLNSNGILTFYRPYIGPKSLSDTQLRSSSYYVSSYPTSDSTAPFTYFPEYWHLQGGQHGVPVPYFNNPDTTVFTQAMIGTIWQDTVTISGQSVTRQYRVGWVSDNYITLVPLFYENEYGYMTRAWKTSMLSSSTPPITSLEFVDAGTGTYPGVNTINVSAAGGYDQTQKYPIMQNKNRKFYVDGVLVTEPGTYYCDEFKVNETQIGYDPSTIPYDDWFAGPNLRMKLDNGTPMTEFTYSYNWKGATCAMNTTVKILRPFRFNWYGALQQQYFFDETYNGTTYNAMFIVPKHKTLNVPFHSGENASSHTYYRTTEYLLDVNDPVDRQIGWLVNPNDSTDFRCGLAGGLSLVSGDTVKAKRVNFIPEGDRPAGASSANEHWHLGSISVPNRNKFYIAAVNGSLFADNHYYAPENFFIEVNAYVSYFDPAQNFGQVYWYKDGNSYVIYCHAQEASNGVVAINVPQFMEGLNLSIVEKTDDAALASNTITNGKFYVNYTGEGQAKYIVLKAN